MNRNDVEETKTELTIRSKAEVKPEVEAYFKRYHLVEMNAINAAGTALWWLHDWLHGQQTWVWLVSIPTAIILASIILNKMQRLSVTASLRTRRPVAGPVTNYLGWLMAVAYLPIAFIPYAVDYSYPKNFFWYMSGCFLALTLVANKVDRTLAKR